MNIQNYLLDRNLKINKWWDRQTSRIGFKPINNNNKHVCYCYTIYFVIIYEFYCTILVNFYFYLKYFLKKYNFSKINGFQ